MGVANEVNNRPDVAEIYIELANNQVTAIAGTPLCGVIHMLIKAPFNTPH